MFCSQHRLRIETADYYLNMKNVLVSVLQRNGTNRTHTEMYEIFKTRIGLHNYGGQVVPQYAICKLKNREVNGVIQPESEALGIRGTNGVTLSPRLKTLEPRGMLV
jgi:hypothetical protein